LCLCFSPAAACGSKATLAVVFAGAPNAACALPPLWEDALVLLRIYSRGLAGRFHSTTGRRSAGGGLGLFWRCVLRLRTSSLFLPPSAASLALCIRISKRTRMNAWPGRLRLPARLLSTCRVSSLYPCLSLCHFWTGSWKTTWHLFEFGWYADV